MKKKPDNISYMKVFVLVVLLAAFVSLTYKVFLLVKNRSFRFSTFNIMLIGRKVHLIGLNTQKKQLQVLELNDGREVFLRYDPLASSIIAGVPLDGMIISKIPQDLIDQKNDFSTFGQALSFLFEDEKYVFYNTNEFDLIKLYIVSKLTMWESSEKSSEKFYDSDIFNEKTSIEIINSTEINGLGGKAGLVLSNLGANVISIKDGEEV